MRLKRVNKRGVFTKGKDLANGTPSSMGNFKETDLQGNIHAVCIFFERKKQDSDEWEEFGLHLTKADYELFKAYFEGK